MNQQYPPPAGGGDPTDAAGVGGQTPGERGGPGQLDPEVQAVLNPNPGNLRTNAPDFAVDPVCGRTVEKASATNTLPAPVNMRGEDTLYFHSPECKALFEQNPGRYGGRL